MTIWELNACVEGWNKRELGDTPPEMTGAQFDELERMTRPIVATKPKRKKKAPKVNDDGSAPINPG
jgi:hypothetical protein